MQSTETPTEPVGETTTPFITEEIIKKASEQIDWDTIKIIVGETVTARFYSKKLAQKSISQLKNLHRRAINIGKRLSLDGDENVLLANVKKELALRIKKRV